MVRDGIIRRVPYSMNTLDAISTLSTFSLQRSYLFVNALMYENIPKYTYNV